jgi:HD superfamily phosphohydrolase
MFPEDERSFERIKPFEQLIDLNFDYSGPERKLEGMTIDDRLYGRFDFDYKNPEDAFITDLLHSDAGHAIWRLGYIEQLTLPEVYATKPEAANFSRLEHSIGCLLLTRKLGGSFQQQVRALFHDAAQGAFSHLDDWRKEGFGGTETSHDGRLKDMLRYFEIDQFVEQYGYDFDGLFDFTITDFVERPSPDLCIDRVDYALREFARWTCPNDVPGLIAELSVEDGMIVFGTQEAARTFGINYLRLYSEHWAEDEHAVREKLLLTAIQEGIRSGAITEADMDATDPEVLVKLELWGNDTIWTLMHLLQKGELDITVHKGFEGAFASDSLENDKNSLFVPIPHFRPRAVDPSFINQDGQRIALSTVDSDYQESVAATVDLSVWGIKKHFETMFDEEGEFVHYAQVKVEPDVKRVLSGVNGLR